MSSTLRIPDNSDYCTLGFWFSSDLATVLEPRWTASELGTQTARKAGEPRGPWILPLPPPLRGHRPLLGRQLLLGQKVVRGQPLLLLLRWCQTRLAVTIRGLALTTAGIATCATTFWCSIANTSCLSLASSASTFSQAWTRGRSRGLRLHLWFTLDSWLLLNVWLIDSYCC